MNIDFIEEYILHFIISNDEEDEDFIFLTFNHPNGLSIHVENGPGFHQVEFNAIRRNTAYYTMDLSAPPDRLSVFLKDIEKDIDKFKLCGCCETLQRAPTFVGNISYCEKCFEAVACNQEIKTDCSICMEPLGIGYHVTECNHHFHRKCLLKWCECVTYKCPLCRHVCDEIEMD